jgi:siderophore synthetase component
MTETELAETLDALEAERVKFTKANKSLMQKLIDRLVEEKVYPDATPTMAKHGYTHLTMVECYGSDWHLWRGTLNCPKCSSDWRDLSAGPPFKREVGRSHGDVTVAWTCPDCGHVVPRRF